ncbi:MAG: PKD domain-containing protein, partial [Sphingobacteriaceae bacterium]
DIMLSRTDSLGKLIWSKTYGGSSAEISSTAFGSSVNVVDLIQVEDSNFVICTQTQSYGKGGEDVYLIKVDKAGNVDWSRTYGGTGNDAGFSVKQIPGGGYIIAGSTASYGAGNRDVLLIKTNDTGGVVWTRTFGGSGEDVAFTAIVTQDSNYVVTGHTYSFGSGSSDFYSLKVDTSGSLLWSRVVGGSGWDLSLSVAEDVAGNLYVTGQSESYVNGGSGDLDFYIVKLSKNGAYIWGKNYGGTKREGARHLFIKDNILNVAGWGLSFGPYATSKSANYYLKLDTAGDVKFMRAYGANGGHANSMNRLISPLRNGGVAIIGSTDAAGAGGYDYYLVKTDADGKTNNCKSDSYTPTKQSNKPTIASHTTSKASPTVSIDKGVTEKSASAKFTYLCEPFVAGFYWKNACKGKSTQFTDTTYKDATAWKWNFGEPASGTSNISSSKNPTHKYADTGTYTVKLVASKTGAIDSITYKVKIYALPKAVISSTATTICLGDSTQLSTNETKGTFYWSPGNLLNDSLANKPWAKPYAASTNFILTVKNGGGCSATDTVNIKTDTSATKCKNLTKIGGVINKYNKVTAIDTCTYALTLNTSGNFKVGDKALLMQMKGAEMDTTNTSDFGTITKYNNAGRYEYVIIDSVAGKNVYAKHKLLYKYDVKSAVQLVYVPVYKNAYITSDLTADAWDGDQGGVLIFEATGIVYLSADIDVTRKGFRGGEETNGKINCHETNYYYSDTSSYSGEKGEGIVVTKSKFAKGRGANANGGGGGNSSSAGGGGGSNYTNGGIGGKEHDFCSGTILANGGVGGKTLKTGYSDGRLFMGGGGGAGHDDDGSWGKDGGGIIIITANSLAGNNKNISLTGNGRMRRFYRP